MQRPHHHAEDPGKHRLGHGRQEDLEGQGLRAQWTDGEGEAPKGRLNLPLNHATVRISIIIMARVQLAPCHVCSVRTGAACNAYQTTGLYGTHIVSFAIRMPCGAYPGRKDKREVATAITRHNIDY